MNKTNTALDNINRVFIHKENAAMNNMKKIVKIIHNKMKNAIPNSMESATNFPIMVVSTVSNVAIPQINMKTSPIF